MKAFGIDFGSIKPGKPRSPRKYLADASHGYPLFPLITLFGLNAVDELDRQVFGILTPNIRDHFHLSDGQITALVMFTLIGGLLLEIPLGYYSDRLPRVRIAIAGAAIWAAFGFGTGLSQTVLMLVLMRIGAGMGRAVVSPTHNSLIADFYPLEARTDAYGLHRLADPVGEFVGAAAGGLIAHIWGWRWPFIVFVLPTAVFVVVGTRLRDPQRGHFERAAGGATEEVTGTDDIPPSFAESVRILWNVGALRRIWYALPFIAGSLLGFGILANLYYDRIFHLNELNRAFISGAGAPLAAIGLTIGIPLAARLMLQDPGIGLRLVAAIGVLIGGGFVVFAFAPSVWVAVAASLFTRFVGALVLPSVFAALSLAIPPKVRSLGFAMASLFVLPGLLLVLIASLIGQSAGLRWGMAFMAPVFIVGAALIATAGKYIKSDINRVWTATAVQAEALYERRQGRSKLLIVRNVDVHYDKVQVLFGVNFEIDEGEVVALLGTNGAGKSTLLKAICGIVEATNGAIVFDGRDATYTPPNETAARGVVLMPGGQATFPGLTVAENLRLAGWTQRRDHLSVNAATDRVLELFPILNDRMHEPAGNLSGGQQQMLGLGMAFIMKPRLLMIDELSLGLAPTIVEQLLGIVAEIAATGTTIILVEQSVNLALELAQTAYFMEKGEIRFNGPTRELLDRPDILRSVFLEGAATVAKPASEHPAVEHLVVESLVVESLVVEHPAVEHPAVEHLAVQSLAVIAAEPGDRTNGVAVAGPSDNPPSFAERLIVAGVSKRFGGLQALDDVHCTIGGGEIVGFLGPNGAGKTTLFDAINGFLELDGGRITLIDHENKKHHDLAELTPPRRSWLGLGRSFQDGRLFPNLTVAETLTTALERVVTWRSPIASALWLPMVSKSEAKLNVRVDELLDLMGIGDFRDKLMRELSTGSKRIVDLACVMAHQPSVLLLDEPSSGIAQREAEALGPLLQRIREQTGASLMIVEHDVPLLLSVADRMVAMDLGRIVTTGTPNDVVNDPRVVAAYLGKSSAAVGRSGTLNT